MERLKRITVIAIETLSLLNLAFVIPAYLFLATITYSHPIFQAPRPEMLALYLASYVVILLTYRQVLHNFDTPLKRWLLSGRAVGQRAEGVPEFA